MSVQAAEARVIDDLPDAATCAPPIREITVSEGTQRRANAFENVVTLLGRVPAELGSEEAILALLAGAERATQDISSWAAVTASGRRLLLRNIAARVRSVEAVVPKGSAIDVAYDVGRRTSRLDAAMMASPKESLADAAPRDDP